MLDRFRRHSLVAAALFLASTCALQAQGARWDWPEKSKNLKVLPADTRPDALRAAMRGFTGALGVRCNYCHVGEEGKPLGTYDFASDANPNKERAREMMRMTGAIAGHLQKIEPSGERLTVRCQTCHQGRPRPTTLAEELLAAYRKDGSKAIAPRYAELRERFYGGGGLDFGERSLNNLGYELLVSTSAGDLEAAIAVLRLNTEQYPKSGNAWDSLAEAYAKAGQSELAAIYYRKSLEVDPANEHALAELRALAAAGGQSGGE
jgi:tetratricopeptide (TPR) repeat protein